MKGASLASWHEAAELPDDDQEPGPFDPGHDTRPDEFDLIIGVTREGEALLLSWPDWYKRDGWLDGGVWADDCGVRDCPDEPGLYRCTVGWSCYGPDDVSFPVRRMATLATWENV